MFKNIDKKIEALGFCIIEENDYVCIYGRDAPMGIQFVTLSNYNKDILIISDVAINGREYRAYPLKVKETKIFLKKIRKLGWCKNIKRR